MGLQREASQRGAILRWRTLTVCPSQYRFARASLMKSNFTDSKLIKVRRLGQTTLSVKAGLVGTSDATKPENLGPFDYAHLRAPLPEELEGSEIHAHHPNATIPKFYFLMVCQRLGNTESAWIADSAWH